MVTGSFDLAPALSNLLKGILGGDDTIKAFFGDERRRRGREPRRASGSGWGRPASEPGNQPGYPADWANRRFVRVGGLLNCETFGVPVGPGCLADVPRPAQETGSQRVGGAAQPKRPRGQAARRWSPRTPAPRRPDRSRARRRSAPLAQTLGVEEAARRSSGWQQARRDTGSPRLTDLLDYLLR